MEVLNNEFQVNDYNASKKLFKNTWSPKTENMSESDYKQEMLLYTGLIEKYKPEKVLINLKDMNYAISPALQDWIDQNLFPRIIAAGLQNVAILVSSELIVNLSVEQAMETPMGTKFSTHYFDNEQDALQWLEG